ncbi:hypothetical protein A2553_03170 [Candidatus Nomurabacteria bacterium RIFOXYD2_FULL_42_12]|nr:MAG: hypothetical protein A2553_03170 [Candidatus Nomurabacteria bacterium RIFOXYD2_FULL_42_12]
MSKRYIKRPPSTEFLDNLSGCHAKIPIRLGRPPSILLSMELKISLPGTLAVFFSINVSMISKLSFSAYSFNSVSCASKLKTWRSSSSVLLRI